jgi:hypothetical protein
MQENFRRWLSPPDPSKNYNIARKAHHKGSAEWFVHGNMFYEWKRATGSLLWIHGKRMSFPLFIIVFLIETRFYSGVREKRAFVREIPFILVQTTDIFD